MIQILLTIILLGGSISLIRSTVGQGTDFLVFWRTGRALIEGASFYDLAGNAGMIFKYPPWIAPLFLPFSFFSFEVGKWMWGVFSTLCLGGVLWIMTRKFKIPFARVAGLAISYWGLWVIQALDGQVVVPLLFFTLMYVVRPSWVGAAATPVLLSTKIFTELPVLIRFKEFLKTRSFAAGGAMIVGLMLVSAWMSFHGNVGEMFREWSAAAQSGATALNEGQTHGPKNQSLSILLCRLLGVSATQTQIEVLISIALYSGFLWFTRRRLKQMSRERAWLWLLAVTPIFHPLPWHHLHIFTFPLAALALGEWGRLSPRKRWGLVIALVLITLSAKRAWVFGAGETLEFYCGRAWGALLLVGIMR